MKFIFSAISLLFALVTSAQFNNSPEKFGKTITSNDLSKHLYIIAGKEMEGRGTGTPGLEKAALYIENEFKRIGLEPGNKNSYQYYFPLFQDSLLSASIQINGTTFQTGRHFNADLRQNTNHHIQNSEIVFTGYGIDDPAYSDYKGIDVKDKVVLIMEGEPKTGDTTYTISGNSKRSGWNLNTSLKIRAASKNGAKAILILVNNFPNFNPGRKQTRGPLYPGFTVSTTAPVYRISDSVAISILGNEQLNLIKIAAKKGSSLQSMVIQKPVELQLEKFQFETKSSDVVGLIPGTDLKDEYVVITGHMDHLGKRDSVIYYGADDDGSGTCAVMEIAEAFSLAKKAGKGPRRSILFMTVSGEEMGLWGSDFYTTNPLFPLEKTTVNLNIDMIGRMGNEYTKSLSDSTKKGDPDSLNYVYIIGDNKLSTDLRPISEKANNQFIHLKLNNKYNDPKDPNRFYYRSDHYNFAEKGVPIIFYFDGVHKDYHRPTDTPDKINYDLYARRAQLVFYTAWEMANRNEMLKRDIKLEMP